MSNQEAPNPELDELPTLVARQGPPLLLRTVRHFFFHRDAEDIDTVLITVVVTLLLAVLALEMQHYDNEANKALDRAQQYAVYAMGAKSRGEMTTSYAWTDVYRQWLEWESRAALADEQGDADAAQRYRAVRDLAAGLTPLLGPDYFDGAAGTPPNLRAFEAATYLVETTALQENYLRAMTLFGVLSDRSGALAMQIVLLGVVLALFALAPEEELLPSRFARRLPVLAGVGITVVVVVWVTLLLRDPLPAYTDEAVTAYANGVGLAYQGEQAGAVEQFSVALRYEPDYASAYYRRGNAHFALGDYAAAAADYQAAWDAGREEVNVVWNLGWTQYVQGDYDQALATTTSALEMAEDEVALIFNLGITQLAAGDAAAAQATYTQGIDLAAAQVAAADGAPSPVLWSYLNTAVEDISRLVDCWEQAVCRATPPQDKLPSDEELKQLARDLRTRLQETAVALEYTGTLPPESVVGEVGALEFGTGQIDALGAVSEFVALGAEGDAPLRFGLAAEEQSSRTLDTSLVLAGGDATPVVVRFPYTQMQDGQLLVLKVYRDGVEAPWLRLVENWSMGPAGEALLPLSPSTQFALADGAYRVEIYLDGRRLQTGDFQLGADADAP